MSVMSKATPDASPAVYERPEVLAITRLFAETFQLATVREDDNFFELGGDSLIAASLISEIEQHFGVGLSISLLIRAPTPATLATAIIETTRDRFARTLVPVRTTGRGPTIFCVHGLDGESFFPERLNRRLGQDRPIYGFRAYGLEEGESPYTAVETIAASYAVTALETRPEGPYVILGHCGIGAMIAWEMTQVLLAQEKDVAGLIVLDPAVTEDRAPFLHMSGMALEMARSRASKQALELAASAEGSSGANAEKRREMVAMALNAALPNYVPTPIDCPLLLLCVTERKELLLNRERGYPNLAKTMEVFSVDTNHLDLFGSQFGSVIGAIGRFLDRVAPLGPSDSAGKT
jgi:acyl carrier protein